METNDHLDKLLLIAEEVISNSVPEPKPKEVHAKNEDRIFLQTISEFSSSTSQPKPKQPNIASKEATKQLETNESSDEENYTDFGRFIKENLSQTSSSSSSSSVTWKTPAKTPQNPPKKAPANSESIFGINITKPLISSALLSEKMQERDAISMSCLKAWTSRSNFERDWVVAGVLVNRGVPKTSQKGAQYCIWQISDLKDEIKTAALFLFGNAYKQLWKTQEGTVVGVLNPQILERRDGSKDEAALAVDNPQKVMILGQSKELGTCKSLKKNGDKCTSIVNIARCEYCVYHVKQEYQKCSKRSELQANFSGKGLTSLRNKVLGKNEVFYGGKSFVAIKNPKLAAKDTNRLQSLQKGAPTQLKLQDVMNRGGGKKKAAAKLDVCVSQRKKDLERLRILGHNKESLADCAAFEKDAATVALPTLLESKSAALDVIAKLKEKKTEASHTITSVEETSRKVNQTPSLSRSESFIDLSKPLPRRAADRAKINALRYIQKNGPLPKTDPNSSAKCTKRSLEQLNETPTAKVAKTDDFFSDRFKKIMLATSRNAHLVEELQNEERNKYFDKLEAKERLEEKMMTTFKVDCKAVRCTVCKYTSFSASEKCKLERHPLKVFNSVKRFFKCGHCGNGTVSLQIVPLVPCTNCGSSKWERSTMMREKIAQGNVLSIRGGERKFLNSCQTNANLDLLVPDD